MADRAPLTGEHLALDLVNTRAATADWLSSPDDLRTWLRLQKNRLDDPEDDVAPFGPTDLEQVRALRDHVAIAVDSARRSEPPPSRTVEALNAAQDSAPMIRELVVTEGSLSSRRTRRGSIGDRLAAWLAAAAVDLLSDTEITEIRQCEATSCEMLFLSKNTRRRWCSQRRCGNRMRVARHYQRNKRE